MRASRKRYSLQNGSILSRKLIFDDNAIAMRLFGSHHLHLAIVEKELNITAQAIGNEITLVGECTASCSNVTLNCSVFWQSVVYKSP